MFEKYKERFDKLEEDHESIRKVKEHVVKYQVAYAIVGGGAITLVGVKLFGKPQVIVKGSEGLPTIEINNNPVIAPVMSIVNDNAGHCCKIVQRLEDEELWGKIKDVVEELAEEHNVSPESVRRMMDRHFRGELENVFGNHYVRIATRAA